MMGRALVVVGWLATAGLVATGVAGLAASQSADSFSTHVLLALLAALMMLFSHCWIMFYLIGTGKAIKVAVAENDLDADFIEQTKDFKNRSYPSLMLAMGLVMATFICGGAGFLGSLPLWVHHLLALPTLGVQIWSLLIEGRVLMANEKLMAGISRQLETDAAAA